MIILASNSPRRKELLGGLDLEFRTWVIPNIDESYPDTLKAEDVAEYIAQKKAIPYFNDEHIGAVDDDDIVLTADTQDKDKDTPFQREDRCHFRPSHRRADTVLCREIPSPRQGGFVWRTGMDRLCRSDEA